MVVPPELMAREERPFVQAHPRSATPFGRARRSLLGTERPRNGAQAAAMDDFALQRFTHLYALNRGVL